MKKGKNSQLEFFNKQYFHKFSKKADVVLNGVDYLRLVLKSNITTFDTILASLNDTNRKFFVEDASGLNLTFVKFNFSVGTSLFISTAYNGIVVPIMLYTVFESNEILKSYGKLDIYGSFFKLMNNLNLDMNKFLEELTQNDFDELLNSPISRLDYRFDFCFQNADVPFPELETFVNIRKNSKYKKHYHDGILESWDYGSRSSKRIFLRMYNKLKEVQSGGKYILYQDYFQFENVYRLEFELLNKFCHGYVFADYMNVVYKLFKLIDVDKAFEGNIYHEYKKDYTFADYSNPEKLRYFSDFGGRGNHILENGINPFIILYEMLGFKRSFKKENDIRTPEENLKMIEDSINEFIKYLQTRKFKFIEKL